MKKFFLPALSGVIALTGLFSCSTKFNVDAPYKNITVIYGLLDMADTAHYIRIQKAFLDETKSAVKMAQTPDSSFYASLDVKLKLVNTQTGNIDSIYTLNRVDLGKEGYPKDTGAFFTAPNYAYKFARPLNVNYNYRLVVFNPATGVTDSADAPIINEDPSVFMISRFTPPLSDIDFNNSQPYHNFTFSGAAPPNAQIFQLMFRFHYHEIDTRTPNIVVNKFADWYQPIVSVNLGNFSYSIPNVDFYSFLRDAMGPPAAVTINRHMDSCDIFAYAGTNDLYTYQVITETQTTGLTANQVKPTFTNIKGQNALGLFTSRGFQKGTLAIDSITIDSLQYNPITSGLNIKLF